MQMHHRAYDTYWITDDWYRYHPGPFHGAGWAIEFRDDPDRRVSRHEPDGSVILGKRVFIRAHSHVAAQSAFSQLYNALHACDGCGAPVDFGALPLPVAPEERTQVRDYWTETGTEHSWLCRSNIPPAALLACRSSRRRRQANALARLGASYSLCCWDMIELHPYHYPFYLSRSKRIDEQVRYATAIVLAYAAIEDLGLEVRATSQKPSKLGDGSWNPPVRFDLEQRLTRARIDIARPFLWMDRGPKVDYKKGRPVTKKNRYSKRIDVHDGDVDLVDAISRVSFLRSVISAHGGGEIRKLSPYEVANAQYLVRRLLLETHGLWQLPVRRPPGSGS